MLLPFRKLLKDQQSYYDQNRRAKLPPSKKKRSRPNDEHFTTEILPPLDPHRRAEAEAAVALAMGTLRYMGARLRGLDQGCKKGDPLRMELDKIRGMLVALRKLESGKAENKGNEKKGLSTKSPSGSKLNVLDVDNNNKNASSNSSAKQRKVVDVDAGQRMIKASLAGDKHSRKDKQK